MTRTSPVFILSFTVLFGCTSSSGNQDSETDSGTDSGSATDSNTETDTSVTSQGTTETTTETTGPAQCMDDAQCDNGAWCDGEETCMDGMCVSGTPPLDCDDMVACTIDVCDEATQACISTPDDTACDDGLYCNGTETCDAAMGCLDGDAPDCADTIDCTVDSCDEENDKCVNKADDDLCTECGETCDNKLGCGLHCTPAMCEGKTYQCGNCSDDDGDCKIDSKDDDCWGPCDNNESGYQGGIPGQQNQSECNVMDCYFDDDSGAGNDSCYWSHSCDPLEPGTCMYNANTSIPGFGGSCSDAQMMQSPTCDSVCGPLVPNGCDCFGCCDVTLPDRSVVTVYLGSHDANDNGLCSYAVADDPDKCWPCTQVQACLNTCEECELCLGKDELPDTCEEQECEDRLQPCGLAGQEPCPDKFSCITGCCVPNPQ